MVVEEEEEEGRGKGRGGGKGRGEASSSFFKLLCMHINRPPLLASSSHNRKQNKIINKKMFASARIKQVLR